MNIYLISQDENNGYDTYDSAIVAAIDEYTAKRIDPATGNIIDNFEEYFYETRNWCTDIKYVKCKFIGIANQNVKKGVILASYNAG